MDNISVNPVFEKIVPYRMREFVPADFNGEDAGQVTAIFTALCEREIASAEELEHFLLDRSELEAVMAQQKAILYIEMTCQTDDPEKAGRYKRFVETILPAVKPLADRLDRKYLQERQRFVLNEKRYEVYDRNTKADAELFREENVPLQTQEELLSQEYQAVCGAMMVNFQGQERTPAHMWKYLEEPDRQVRQSAWKAITDRYLQDADRLDGILDQMLAIRQQIAANAGFDSYVDYKFREYHRFDYTVEACRQFHRAVEKRVVPVLAGLYKQRKSQMGLPSLRPWDRNADPLSRPPLKPFDTMEDYLSRSREVFDRIDPQLGGQFQQMIDLGLLDLASRKGKAPGGYQENLWEACKPFIFGNAVGTDWDVGLLMHEGGHAFHSFACADQPLLAYRNPPIEFCEVASMAMEMFALEHRTVFYSEEDANRSRRKHLESVIYGLIWIAAIDAFQHWLYEHPGHRREERAEAWIEIYSRFGGDLIDWSGYLDPCQYLWHRQLHIFQFPFYYIEYGIAQLGALGLWRQSRQDPAGALGRYRRALALGGSRPLPELFAAAGLEFDFSEKTISPLIEAVQEELAQLS